MRLLLTICLALLAGSLVANAQTTPQICTIANDVTIAICNVALNEPNNYPDVLSFALRFASAYKTNIENEYNANINSIYSNVCAGLTGTPYASCKQQINAAYTSFLSYSQPNYIQAACNMHVTWSNVNSLLSQTQINNFETAASNWLVNEILPTFWSLTNSTQVTTYLSQNSALCQSLIPYAQAVNYNSFTCPPATTAPPTGLLTLCAFQNEVNEVLSLLPSATAVLVQDLLTDYYDGFAQNLYTAANAYVRNAILTPSELALKNYLANPFPGTTIPNACTYSTTIINDINAILPVSAQPNATAIIQAGWNSASSQANIAALWTGIASRNTNTLTQIGNSVPMNTQSCALLKALNNLLGLSSIQPVTCTFTCPSISGKK